MVPKAAFAPDDLIPEFKRLTFRILLYHTASGKANSAR
jgi:hypothetical protein